MVRKLLQHEKAGPKPALAGVVRNTEFVKAKREKKKEKLK